MMKIRIEGAGRLQDQIKRLEEISVVGPVVKAASQVQAQAKLQCPGNHGELRNSILLKMYQESELYAAGTVYTNKSYAPHVEFGTGPMGQEHHEGVSPNTTGAYVQTPWWFHESQVDKQAAEKYRWFYIDTPDGRFYQSSGQPAQPFLYPALKNQEEKITGLFQDNLRKEIRKQQK